MNGNGGRQIRRGENSHAISLDHFVRFAECAVAAGCAGQIDDNSSTLHSCDRFFSYQKRRATSGNLGSRDHHVGGLCVFGNQIPPALIASSDNSTA